MKSLYLVGLGLLVSVSSYGRTVDLGVTQAADSLQAKLEQLLQDQFEAEERNGVDEQFRAVRQTAEGAYQVEGSNGTLTCQEYGPGPGISIQIQSYGCKLELE